MNEVARVNGFVAEAIVRFPNTNQETEYERTMAAATAEEKALANKILAEQSVQAKVDHRYRY